MFLPSLHEMKNRRGWSPLGLAVIYGRMRIMKYFFELGFCVSATEETLLLHRERMERDLETERRLQQQQQKRQQDSGKTGDERSTSSPASASAALRPPEPKWTKISQTLRALLLHQLSLLTTGASEA